MLWLKDTVSHCFSATSLSSFRRRRGKPEVNKAPVRNMMVMWTRNLSCCVVHTQLRHLSSQWETYTDLIHASCFDFCISYVRFVGSKALTCKKLKDLIRTDSFLMVIIVILLYKNQYRLPITLVSFFIPTRWGDFSSTVNHCLCQHTAYT